MYVQFPYICNDMARVVKSDSKTRFDARLTIKEKALLEEAANLGGYRSLSDFILSAARQQALALIEAEKSIIRSHEDSIVFFDALINPPLPNAALKAASKRFKKASKK